MHAGGRRIGDDGARRAAWAGWMLAACAVAGPVAGAEFDWRARGILFRVQPVAVAAPVPVPPGDAGAVAGPGPEGGEAPAPVQPAGEPAPASAVDAGAPAPVHAATDVPHDPPAPSYVFATIHYGSADELQLYLPRLRRHLGESRVLVNEIDLQETWKPEYERYRMLGPGRSLRRLIGDEAFDELRRQLPDVAPETLDALKPWVVMSMLEFPFGSEERSIDRVLQDWAAEADVPRLHLEYLPDQLAALDCVPPDRYAPVLQQRLLRGWSFDLDAERTVGYYRERDLAAWIDDLDSLQGLTGAAVSAETEIRRCLIGLRNERWLPVLEERLQQGGAFVAVGAIHLAGNEGLLAQLSRRGFVVTVEPW